MATTTAVRRTPTAVKTTGTTTRRLDQKYVATVNALQYPPVVEIPVEPPKPVIRPLPDWFALYQDRLFSKVTTEERDFVIDKVDKDVKGIQESYLYYRRNYEHNYKRSYELAVDSFKKQEEQRKKSEAFRVELMEKWLPYQPNDQEVMEYLTYAVPVMSYAIACKVENDGMGTISQCCGSLASKRYPEGAANDVARNYDEKIGKYVNRIWFQKLLPGEQKVERKFNPEELILKDEETGETVVINWVNPQ